MSEQPEVSSVEKSLERIAEALESISLFLHVLMGEDQAEATGPANYIHTQDGIVDLRNQS